MPTQEIPTTPTIPMPIVRISRTNLRTWVMVPLPPSLQSIMDVFTPPQLAAETGVEETVEQVGRRIDSVNSIKGMM